MNTLQLVILFISAISVLVSYYVFLQSENIGYLNHPFWFGMPENIVNLLIFFIICAIIGFIGSVGSWLIQPPTTGILGNYLFYILLLFFISAAIWPIVTYYNYGLLTVFSLICTAIASILLLVGSIEEENQQVLRVLGLICLCITTVLGDGVVWNTNYIKKNADLFKLHIVSSFS